MFLIFVFLGQIGRYITLWEETIAYKAERQGKTTGNPFVVGGLEHHILRLSDLLFLGVRKDGNL